MVPKLATSGFFVVHHHVCDQRVGVQVLDFSAFEGVLDLSEIPLIHHAFHI
jgi:hypothetical protein